MTKLPPSEESTATSRADPAARRTPLAIGAAAVRGVERLWPPAPLRILAGVEDRAAALAGRDQLDRREAGRAQPSPLAQGAVVALVDHLVAAAEKGEQPRLVRDPVEDAQREHDVRPKGEQLRFPAGVAVEVDPAELRLHAERARGQGRGREDRAVAVDRERRGGARLAQQEDREQAQVAAELEHAAAATGRDPRAGRASARPRAAPRESAGPRSRAGSRRGCGRASWPPMRRRSARRRASARSCGPADGGRAGSGPACGGRSRLRRRLSSRISAGGRLACRRSRSGASSVLLTAARPSASPSRLRARQTAKPPVLAWSKSTR